MRVNELIEILETFRVSNPEVRIGDQIEAGPYEHFGIVGLWKGEQGTIILCGNPDEEGYDESPLTELPKLWASD